MILRPFERMTGNQPFERWRAVYVSETLGIVVRVRDGEGDPDPRRVPIQHELTVVVADDHAGYRAGLIRAVTAWRGLRLVGEADDGASALRLIEDLEPDVALIDVRMPGLTGLELCAQLPPDHHTRVVLLSAFMDDKLAARASASGAAGCVSKQVSRTRICREIEAVAGTTGRAGAPR